MRRHPIDRSLPRIARALLAGPLLVGCFMSDTPGTAGRAPGVALTIATAPGNTLAFVPADPVVATAGSIALSFRNGSTLAHNLVFTDGLSAATRTIVEPGTDDHVLLEPSGPGAYPFVCTIHDGMAGVLLVEAPPS